MTLERPARAMRAVTALRVLGLALALGPFALWSAAAGAQAKGGALDALQNLGNDLLGGGQPEFLTPEEAFQLDTRTGADGRLEFSWNIAPGYYLYRERMSFEPATAGAATLGEARMPDGKLKHDDYFGEMEVYYIGAEASVPVLTRAGQAAADPRALDVKVSYQGCADAGLCYPPVIKTVSFELGSGGASGVTSAVAAAAAAGSPGGTSGASDAASALPERGAQVDAPEQDRLAASLARGFSVPVLATFFGLGLLLTFTPCVLPMIPILSSIIAGQGERAGGAGGFALSLVYVLAMALTYTAAGVAAGLSGAGVQAAFQDPWVIGALALVFVALSLSMFGFYELQLPSGLQSRLAAFSGRQRGGTYAGAGIMGVLSALVVSPCVAAPLAGALIYIGQSGDGVLGGLALFSLSLGMGMPLLLIGAFGGAILPKAGPWMDQVKAVFGVVMLAMAIYLLDRVVPGWVTLLMCAALLIVTAIYMGALDSLAATASGWRRLWKGAGLVMMVYGVLLMVGASNGGSNLMRPLESFAIAGAKNASGEHLVFRRVKGTAGLSAALEAASAQGKSVMLDYYADWCVSCKEMERFTFTSPLVRSALDDVLLLQTDVTANDEQDKALLSRFGLFGPPAILFFGPEGEERRQFRVVGYMSADDFAPLVARAVAPKVARSGATKVARDSVASQASL